MKRRLWALVGVAVLTVAVLGSAHSIAADPKLGWEKFEFAGNESFSDKQLRRALIGEPEFLLATHPNSDRSTVGRVVTQLLKAGYENAGFKSPRIEFQGTNDGGGMITIDEGQRFRCGEVLVLGTHKLDARQLIERLTQPYAKHDSFPAFVEHNGETSTRWVDQKGQSVDQETPVWPLGSFVKFGSESDLNNKVVAALKDLGFSSGKAIVTINPNDSDLTAKLAVEISDEGPNDIADVFHVGGTQTNSPNAVLSFLELTPGVAVNQTLIQSVTKRLWDCGRFKKHNVHFDRDENGQGRLNIELADVKGVPSLAEPLSETAIVFMRARTWLNGVNDRNEDISLTFRDSGNEFEIVQSRQGLLVQMRVGDVPNEQAASISDVNLSLMFDDQFVTFVNARNDSLWRASIGHFEGKVRLETNFSAAEDDDKFSVLNLSGNCHSRRSKDEAPFSSNLNLSPADWSGFAYKDQVQTRVKDGRLHVTRETDHLEMDRATGQVYRWENKSAGMRIEAGLFAKLKNEVAVQSSAKNNDYDASRPVSTLVRHLFSAENRASMRVVWELCHDDDKPFEEKLAPALVKLIDGKLLRPFDAFMVYTANEQANEKFEIPYMQTKQLDSKRTAMQLVGKYGLKCAPEVFAEGTWPMSVTREACLVMIDRGMHTGTVLKELRADNSNGPLCDASIAFLLSLAQQKAIASKFAQRSLERLSPERFHSDVATLMSGPSGRWMTSVLSACESLSVDEIESLRAIGLSDRVVTGLYGLQNQGKTSEESYLFQIAKSGLEGVLGGIVQR